MIYLLAYVTDSLCYPKIEDYDFLYFDAKEDALAYANKYLIKYFTWYVIEVERENTKIEQNN